MSTGYAEMSIEEQGRTLWLLEVTRLLMANEITPDESATLRTWDADAINGVQWSKGGIDAIRDAEDAKQAVAETLAFQRAA